MTISVLIYLNSLNPLSANPTKWSNTLKQFAAKLPTNSLSVFDHFVKSALQRLILEGGFAENPYLFARYLLASYAFGSMNCAIPVTKNLHHGIHDLTNKR